MTLFLKSLPPLLGMGFLSGLAFAVLHGRLPRIVLIYYVLLSCFTFVVYWQDKRAAIEGVRRTKELTLLRFSVFGGWPGAIAAHSYLHHKCSKKVYQLAFWIVVVVNCVVTIWLSTPDGLKFLQAIFEIFGHRR